MATRVETTFIDDMDGVSTADGTVRFGLDGTDYEIDLTTANADALRAAFAPYMAAARPAKAKAPAVGRSGRTRSGGSRNDFNRAARAWLRSQGHTINERGRIAPSLLATVPPNVVEIMAGESSHAAPTLDLVITRETGDADGDTTGTVSVVTAPEQTAAIPDGAAETEPAADGDAETKTPAKTRAPRASSAKTAANGAKTPATRSGGKTTKTAAKTTADAATA